MEASKLIEAKDYPNFPEFRKWNIDLGKVDAALILTLQQIRQVFGIAIYPSPIQEAWSRTTGSPTSRHFAVDRLSDAGDIFPARGKILDLWLYLQPWRKIGGLGIYADTKGIDGLNWPMMHIDLRMDKTLWASEIINKERVYYYFPSQSADFWRVVGRIAKE